MVDHNTTAEEDTKTGPADERWSLGDVALTGLLFGMGAALTPVVAYIEGGVTGAILVLAPLTVVFAYESGIVPQLKWEISRRIRGE
ncbi:hypothetical protein [Natronorubrum daqingense]|uniref:Uncharacterized protein n=1 Tax=Natronorubrum daqingense TaxID=588898 RepID=A0A1N7FXH9_9EURY|nr:hypothetical protein [Natronorubrum daqingense]APX98535.1 hypothetical protein BB347_17660 [Natronorubrum daqingense]SIS05004.1 hypothetical protein SAMN05421809_3539 [Natronorubrum daqingense]